MTRYILFFITLLLVAVVDSLKAQEINASASAIASSPLEISDRMTTNLIFPQAIKSVDRGSRSILAQKAHQVENILQVKAESSQLEDSNLTVITADGSFYSFAVAYRPAPRLLNLKIQSNNNLPRAELADSSPTASEIVETARQVSSKNRSIPAIRQRRFMTGIGLNGIYIAKDLFFFQLVLENQSHIPYDIGQLRLFIRDTHQSKRSATQELEQVPHLVWGDADRIPAQSTQTVVVVLDKFTIPDQKHLRIELMEQNGGRNLRLKVKNHQLVKATTLQ